MALKGMHTSEETKEKMRKAALGKKRKIETNEKLSNTRKKLFAEGKLEVWNKSKTNIYTFETRQRISNSVKKLWYVAEYRKRASIARSKMMMKRWSDQEFYKKMYPILIENGKGLRNDPVVRAKRRAKMMIRWRDSEFVSKVKNKLKLKPSNPELYLDAVLQLNFKNEWKYTGDFAFWIDGKKPRFC
jgi:hypothetical protein